MTRILLSGANGRMGQAIVKLASNRNDCKIVAGIDINTNVKNDFEVYASFSEVPEDLDVDVIIDFTNPSLLIPLADFARDRKTPLVVATTGLSKQDMEYLQETAKTTSVLYSANMSLGICLLKDLVKRAVLFLGEGFDIEIIEKHHNQKLDAPSGTALALADSINAVDNNKYEYIYDRHSRKAKRSPREIGFSSIRGGNIVGDHDVIFAGNNEIIEISHKALSRDIFADGALRAALFLKDNEKGFYTMDDLLS
ncbi:MAG TPA: 4-hydroxy-tetrahydrodipicolinate reductase [Clostridiaceae bacterium]|jgi:4-hydroxy-tetrahydrodipicolinate reductase|nr:4-hydroxy-tetrahydrodipicolinate reductase [Clostridiaceae bacterium]HOA30619.1 4-hydroxy-tetrahydrodipicolinate reductase [Clostridia bacterium]